MQRNLLRPFRRFNVLYTYVRSFQVTTTRTGTIQDDTTTASDESRDRKTHFGFETVTEKEKEDKVYNVFHNVAEKYDLMNDCMSGGVHRLWKDYFISKMAPTAGTRLLDVAGGTGDIAFRFLDYIKNQSANTRSQPTSSSESTDGNSSSVAETHVTVCDINQAMLDVGQRKAVARGIDKTGNIHWLQANAEDLPLDDDSFDVYTVAFGIRNMTHIEQVLDEAYRVLRHGGRFMCLEFSEVSNPFIQRFYDAYSFQLLPVMGQVVAGDWKSYQYLVESIRQFPPQEEFQEMIEDAGFCNVTFENLLFGVAAIHSGFKL